MAIDDGYFDASYNGQRLFVTSFRSNGGRDVVVQSPSRGNAHTISDRGIATRDTICELIFAPKVGLPNHVDRFREFKADCESGKSFLFVHPIDGSYLAKVGPLPYAGDGNENALRCTVTFIEDQDEEIVAALTISTPAITGADSVTAAANSAADAVAIAGSVTVAAPAAASVADAWATTDALDPHQVFLDVSNSVYALDLEIDKFEDTIDPNQWAAYKALILVRYEIVKAGNAATQSVALLIDYTVAADAPLRVICAEVYGVELANQMADEVIAINRLRTPACVPRGTVLKMPAAGSGGT